MRVLVPVLLIVAVAVAVALLVRGGDEPYKVRAIFDNAGFVIAGEDVKVAGVKVGKVDSLEVTDDNKAAITLRIDDPAYQDFRRDAHCSIRPQSLIGERFIECEPTQARQASAPQEPELEEVDGARLLPVENTSKPVDLDLINNITREPQQARLSIILSELGTGVAGRGSDLNEVIRRANPALKEVDEVLEILASENDTLEKLAVDGDRVLAPLARERRRVSSALDNSAEVAQATAERRDELEADIERLPAFLRELKPTMNRLGSFSDEATPVLSDLGDEAPAINRVVRQLGPFSEAGIPALESLGEAAEVGIPALEASRPIIGDLRVLARQVRPLGATAAKVLTSVQSQRGFERVMDYIFYQVAAINGFDSFGHYLRAGLIVNQCSTYAASPTPGCSANFSSGSASAASAGGPSDPVLKATAEAIRQALSGENAKAEPTPDAVPRLRAKPSPSPSPSPTPTAAPDATVTPVPTPSATPAPAASPTPAPGPATPEEPLLDFLFGKEPAP